MSVFTSVQLKLAIINNRRMTFSQGCIFGEVLQRATLFPGADPIDQLRVIVNFIGPPSEFALTKMPISERASNFIRSIPFKRTSFSKHILSKSPVTFFETLLYSTFIIQSIQEAIELLNKMLAFDFNDRISAEDAILTEYIMPVRERAHNEMVAPCHITLPCIKKIDGTKETICRVVIKLFVASARKINI